ncbi:PCI domain containing protein [Tritrichomonas foetus]|uniref:PCI domain containing protein n=1 Tax=Tritrichomonas foetus TaxID=1144522 RepID=A0A1J4K659_9EUKA|nr:PCI domain containing protein [Tritrichomonas foetus]|eukprot:OHT06659.1 PCI domain containing protein [Tritrichomonas foetus]
MNARRQISDTQKVSNELKKAIIEQRGDVIARFFDIQYLKERREACQRLVNEGISRALGHDLWMEAFSFLFEVPLADDENIGFSLYNQASSPLIRDFKSLVSNLGVPCVKSIAKTLRYYATYVDYNESVNQMQKLLRLALTTRNNVNGGSSLLTVVNELMAVYFQKNNIKQANNLLKTVNDAINFDYYSPSEVCTFRFNRGRLYAIQMKISEAHSDLLAAYNTCPLSLKSNRCLILLYLIPVQLFYGQLPTTKNGLIEFYGLDGIFTDFAIAIALGLISKFDQAIQRNQVILLKLGLYHLMAAARKLVYYQILRIVHKTYNSNKIPVEAFLEALKLSSKTEDNKEKNYTIDEAESIVSTLIEMKLVKAYVHHGLHFIVFGKDPFQIESSMNAE